MTEGSYLAAAAALEEDFALFDDWRDKIEYVIDLGKRLPDLPDAAKSDANKVEGCQSQVWMTATIDPASGRLRIAADSDAHLVRGLIALLLKLYDDRPPEEILAHPPEVFERIGLGRLLTPGRANGLFAMRRRLEALAAAARASDQRG